MNLFVRNLPWSISELKLREVFEKTGKVLSVKIVTDAATGRSRGFGFVRMSSAEEGQKAIDVLNGEEIDGRQIVVDQARDNRDSRDGRDSRDNRRK